MRIIPHLPPFLFLDDIASVLSDFATARGIMTSIDAITHQCDNGKFTINEDKVTALAQRVEYVSPFVWGLFLRYSHQSQLHSLSTYCTYFDANAPGTDPLGLISQFSSAVFKWWGCAACWEVRRVMVQQWWTASQQ
jgi:hypothetical protein